MASPQGSARYHLLMRPSEDLAGDESPVASLLPKTRMPPRKAKTYTFTLNPTLGLRLLSNITAVTAFIIFIVDAVHKRNSWYRRSEIGDYIAAAVFLGLILVHNFLMAIHQLVVRSFRITIEFRNQDWSPIRENKKKPKVGVMLDLGLASCLALSLIIGNGVGKHHFNEGRIVAVVFAYITVTLTVKLEPRSADEESIPSQGDIKLPVTVADLEEDAHRRSHSMHGARPSDVDEPRQSAEQLV